MSLTRKAGGAFPNGPLIILYGSQTGTAEGFANSLARDARARGFDAKARDIEQYEPAGLADEDEAPVVFLVATHGEGEPTDSAAAFFQFLRDERCDNLKSLRFAVFALGNRQYEHFCGAGKWLDGQLAKLNAERFYALGTGDDDDDLDGDFERWTDGLWPALCGGDAGAGGGAGGGAKLPTRWKG